LRRGALIAATALATLAAPAAPLAPPPAPKAPGEVLLAPPPGWTDLADTLRHARFDLAYHGDANFTGRQLPGYGAPGAWLLQGPAEALAAVEADLATRGLGLVVFDAYRPRRATEAMVAWAYRAGQPQLVLGGYISPTSFHNRGMAVDVGLYRLEDGEAVDMGTAFDDLTPASHTANATGEALQHRQTLVAAMRARGWRNYHREWWHFSWPRAGEPPRRDLPYACYEPPEGAWAPPPRWDRPGWIQPDTWGTAPCDPPPEFWTDP
jgi:D-alanyl-D-alanine dipeptidase